MVLITLNIGLKVGNSPKGPRLHVPSHVGSIHHLGIVLRIPIHLDYQVMVFNNGPSKITKDLLKWYYTYFIIFRDNWCAFLSHEIHTRQRNTYGMNWKLWIYDYISTSVGTHFLVLLHFLSFLIHVLDSNFRQFILQLHSFLFLNQNSTS